MPRKRPRRNPTGPDGRWAPGIHVRATTGDGFGLILEREPSRRLVLSVHPGRTDARGRTAKRGAHRGLSLGHQTHEGGGVWRIDDAIGGRWNTRTGKVEWFVGGPVAGRSLQVLVGRQFLEDHALDVDTLLELLMRQPKIGETYALARANPTIRVGRPRPNPPDVFPRAQRSWVVAHAREVVQLEAVHVSPTHMALRAHRHHEAMPVVETYQELGSILLKWLALSRRFRGTEVFVDGARVEAGSPLLTSMLLEQRLLEELVDARAAGFDVPLEVERTARAAALNGSYATARSDSFLRVDGRRTPSLLVHLSASPPDWLKRVGDRRAWLAQLDVLALGGGFREVGSGLGYEWRPPG